MSSRRAIGRTVRLAIACALALVLVPDSTGSPAAISLTTVDTAKRVDFGEDIVWVLVLGSDARPGEDVNKGNTDAIHLVGIDGRTGRAVGIGIPRDSWLELPGFGFDRINQALIEGGDELVADVVEELVGIRPDYVLVTGFDGFVAMMSAVGPIEVIAPEGFSNGGTVVKEGLNTFDPDQVLDFVRYRLTLVGDDFARSANQQRVLVATLKQMRRQEDDEGFMERATLAALGGLETDLGPTELYRFAQAVTQVDPRKVSSCVLPGEPSNQFGASVVLLDEDAARRIGADASDDTRLQDGCEP